jgi:hypothetical protein
MMILGRMTVPRDTSQTPGNMLLPAWYTKCELEIEVLVLAGACIRGLDEK